MAAKVREENTVDFPVKLLIDDILKLKGSTDPNLYMYGGREIRIVDILGVVLESRMVKNDHFIYKVDDGSGTIVCIHNIYGRNITKMQEDLKFLEVKVPNVAKDDENVSEALGKVLLESRNLLSKRIAPDFNQGDCAHVKGFITDFHDSREIRVIEIFKVTNVNDDIDRNYELSAIYSKLYDTMKKDTDQSGKASASSIPQSKSCGDKSEPSCSKFKI